MQMMDDTHLAEIEARLRGESDPQWMIREYRKDIAALLAEVRSLRDQLATVEHVRTEERAAWMAEAESLRHQLDHMTNVAALSSGKRATIVDAGWQERAERAEAALAEVMPSDAIADAIHEVLSATIRRQEMTDYERDSVDAVEAWLSKVAARKAVG
jgi:vacuolar-type H+-ATPase subunit I/STV1